MVVQSTRPHPTPPRLPFYLDPDTSAWSVDPDYKVAKAAVGRCRKCSISNWSTDCKRRRDGKNKKRPKTTRWPRLSFWMSYTLGSSSGRRRRSFDSRGINSSGVPAVSMGKCFCKPESSILTWIEMSFCQQNSLFQALSPHFFRNSLAFTL